MKLKFSYTTVLRVRYSETDQMGYCYYGNYAQYCEVGRVETMRSLGISYKELEEKGILMPVSEFQINYIFPAKYDDELHITTTIDSIKGARVIFTYEIKLPNDQLIAKATTTLVFIRKSNLKPIQAPDFFMDLIEQHAYE